jgi:hypothetical protein
LCQYCLLRGPLTVVICLAIKAVFSISYIISIPYRKLTYKLASRNMLPNVTKIRVVRANVVIAIIRTTP